jgi:hypothetical protein
VASHPAGAQEYFLQVFCSLNESYQEAAINMVRKLASEQEDES